MKCGLLVRCYFITIFDFFPLLWFASICSFGFTTITEDFPQTPLKSWSIEIKFSFEFYNCSFPVYSLLQPLLDMGVLVARFYSFRGELCSIRIWFLVTEVSVDETANNILRIPQMEQVVSLFLKVWFRMDHVVGHFKLIWIGRLCSS